MARRNNGEGSVIQLSNGSWAGQYTYKGKRKAVYGKTRQEAVNKLHIAIEEMNSGLAMDERNKTLGEWLDYWLQYYAKPRIKRSTYVSYEMITRVHVKPEIGDVQMRKLSVRVLQEFLVKKLKQGDEDGLSLKSVKNIKNMLHNALEQAVASDMVAKNYCGYVQLPRERKAEERVLSQEEQNAIVIEARKYCHEAAFGVVLAVYTGLRKGELLALQWRDFDVEKRVLHIHQAINRLHVDPDNKTTSSKTEIVIGTTKSSSSDRDIPLFDELYNEMCKFKERQQTLKLNEGIVHNETDFIITGRNFCHIEPRYFEQIFQNVARNAGVENVHLHTLRHTFATRCIEQGCDIYVLSKLLGHAQPSTTLNRYGHALPDHKRQSMDKVSAIFCNNTQFQILI